MNLMDNFSSSLDSAQYLIYYILICENNSNQLNMVTLISENIRSDIESLELLHIHLHHVQNPGKSFHSIAPPSVSSKKQQIFLEYCNYIVENIETKDKHNKNIIKNRNEILVLLSKICINISRRNTFRSKIVSIIKDLTGTISSYSIKRIQCMVSNNEPLHSLLNHFERKCFVDALTPIRDYRIEFYELYHKYATDYSIFKRDNNEINEFIIKIQTKYLKENIDIKDHYLTEIDIFDMPRTLSYNELNQLPFPAIKERIDAISIELKQLKRLKREKLKQSETHRSFENLLLNNSISIKPQKLEPEIKKDESFLSPRQRKRESLRIFSNFDIRLGPSKIQSSRNSISRSFKFGSASNSFNEFNDDSKEQPRVSSISHTNISRSYSLTTMPDDSDLIKRNLSGSLSARSVRKVVSQIKLDSDSPKDEKIEKLVYDCSGFWLENGNIYLDREIYEPDEEDNEIPIGEWYSTFFYSNEHSNYYSDSVTDGPVVISVKKEKDFEKNTFYRALYRSKHTTTGLFIPQIQLRGNIPRGRTVLLTNLFQNINPLFHFKQFRKCNNRSFRELVDFEDLEYIKILKQDKFKVGVVCWQEGNKDEEDMFCNTIPSEESISIFNILGDKIKLENWKGYNGGLDTINKGTGKYSIYTKYENKEFMFHVATILPFSDKNRQQVERKRHIGNDVVVIIIRDATASPFLPSIISSQFNHIFIIITPKKTNDILQYHVAITAREGVPFFKPNLPLNGIFTNVLDLRIFLLKKIISGEHAAAHAPAFTNRISKTRELLLKHIANTT